MQHLRGLDGIRGIALIMVLLIHGRAWFMEGGFFAVDVFFVLSGFLITYLLLREYLKTGSISLINFWIRRGLRLFPALGAVLVFILIFSRIRFDDETFGRVVTDVIDTVTYRINWRMAGEGQPPLGMLSHGWSLAVEMQFYIVWPLIVILLLAFTKRIAGTRGPEYAVGFITVVALTLSVVGMLVRTGEALAGFDWWRTYYGTDCRVDALLMGCALAGLFSLGRLGRWPRWGGLLGGGVIVALVVVGDLGDQWVPLWGSSLVTVSAALLIIDLINRGPTTPVLSLAPLVFLGQVSYGAYLWHWPVYAAINESWLPLPTYLLLAIRIAMTLVIATISYHVIELPALRLKSRFTTVTIPARTTLEDVSEPPSPPDISTATTSPVKGIATGDVAAGEKPGT